MDLKQQIAAIERFQRTLGNLSFTVSITAGGAARVKYKKKIVIAECPDKAYAEVFAESLNTVVKNTQGRVDDILNHLSLRCEQLSIFEGKKISDFEQHGFMLKSFEGQGEEILVDDNQKPPVAVPGFLARVFGGQ